LRFRSGFPASAARCFAAGLHSTLLSFRRQELFYFFFPAFFHSIVTSLPLSLSASGDEERIYSILPPAVKNFFPALCFFFEGSLESVCFRAVDYFRLPSLQILAYNTQAENCLSPALSTVAENFMHDLLRRISAVDDCLLIILRDEIFAEIPAGLLKKGIRVIIAPALRDQPRFWSPHTPRLPFNRKNI
jgi:hypothetical protein